MEGVDVDQGGLQHAQAQHGQFLLIATVGDDIAADVDFIVLEQGIDTSTPIGRG